MNRPSLNDHLAADPDRDRVGPLRTAYYAASDSEDTRGLAALLATLISFVGLLGTWFCAFPDHHRHPDRHALPLAAAIVITVAVIGLLVLLWKAVFRAGKRCLAARGACQELSDRVDRVTRASIVADVRATYGIDVDPKHVPLAADTATHATAVVDGEPVQVVLTFPAADAPILVSKMKSLPLAV